MRSKFNIILSITTYILLFSSIANATVTGAIQNIIPQADGSLIINGWACDTTKKSDVWLEIFPGIRGTTGVYRISWGGTQVNSPVGTNPSCIDRTSGFRYRVSSANVSKFSGKSLWGYIMVNGVPTQMGGSGSYIIEDNEDNEDDGGDNNQNQQPRDRNYDTKLLDQLLGINESNTGHQVDLTNLNHSNSIGKATKASSIGDNHIKGFRHDGDVVIDKDGVTLENCMVNGTVTVREGITGTKIINCAIDAKFQPWGIMIQGNNTSIQNVEIKNALNGGIGLRANQKNKEQANNTHIKRVHIFNCVDGIQSRPLEKWKGGHNPVTNLLIEESYIHDSLSTTKAQDALDNFDKDPFYKQLGVVGGAERVTAIKKALNNAAGSNGGTHIPHVDGIQIAGNKNVVIRHNRITIPNEHATAAIFIKPDAFFAINVMAVGNLVSGGGYTLKVGENKPGSLGNRAIPDARNILIADNFIVNGKWKTGFAAINASFTTATDGIVIQNNKSADLSFRQLIPNSNPWTDSNPDAEYTDKIDFFKNYTMWEWSGWPTDWPVN